MVHLTDDQQRNLHLGGIAAAVVLMLVGLLALGGPEGAAGRQAVMVLLVGLLGLEGWLLARDLAASRAAPAAAGGWEPPAETGAADAGGVPLATGSAGGQAMAAQAQRIVIKCKQCGEVFPVHDTGARPLAAACPHCGKSGTIRVKHG